MSNSDLILISEPHHYQVTVPREVFTTLFPESVITSTLILNPETDEIKIPNVVITPQILDLLREITTTQTVPPKTLPNSELEDAYRYLNIPLFLAMSDPNWSLFRIVYPDIDPFHPDYEVTMDFALRNQSEKLAESVFLTHPPDEKQDSMFFVVACYSGNVRVAQLLKQRGVDPSTAKIWQMYYDFIPEPSEWDRSISQQTQDQGISYAIYHRYTELVRYLLTDPRVGKGNMYDLLHLALIARATAIFAYLITDPRFNQQIGLQIFPELIDNAEFVRLLLTMVDPSPLGDKLLNSAINNNNLGTVTALLNDVRIDPLPGIILAFSDLKYIDRPDYDMVVLLVTHPRININDLPENFFRLILRERSGREGDLGSNDVMTNYLLGQPGLSVDMTDKIQQWAREAKIHPEVPIDQLPVAELKRRLADLGLPITGLKSELQDRLRENTVNH